MLLQIIIISLNNNLKIANSLPTIIRIIFSKINKINQTLIFLLINKKIIVFLTIHKVIFKEILIYLNRLSLLKEIILITVKILMMNKEI